MSPDIQERLIRRKLEENFPDSILDTVTFRDELTIIVKKEDTLKIVQFLRDDDELGFNFLVDIAVVDFLVYKPYEGAVTESTKISTASHSQGAVAEFARIRASARPRYDYGGRFAVVYHLLSHERKTRLRVRAHVSEDDMTIDSMYPLWKTADWLEREIYDMFGVKFNHHPDLRRILTPDGFESYPLRKDYPLEGKGERDNFPVIERGWKK